jgi:hypothetical protein
VLCLVCDGEYVDEGRLNVRRGGGSLLCLGRPGRLGKKFVRIESRSAMRERGREEREDNNNIMCIPLRREPGPRVRLSGSVIKVRGLGMFYAGGPRAWWQR